MPETVETCSYVYFLGSYSYPPEGCEEDAMEGCEYCPKHFDGLDPSWDYIEDN